MRLQTTSRQPELLSRHTTVPRKSRAAMPEGKPRHKDPASCCKSRGPSQEPHSGLRPSRPPTLPPHKSVPHKHSHPLKDGYTVPPQKPGSAQQASKRPEHGAAAARSPRLEINSLYSPLSGTVLTPGPGCFPGSRATDAATTASHGRHPYPRYPPRDECPCFPECPAVPEWRQAVCPPMLPGRST